MQAIQKLGAMIQNIQPSISQIISDSELLTDESDAQISIDTIPIEQKISALEITEKSFTTDSNLLYRFLFKQYKPSIRFASS